jgi:PKD repeat protein
MKKVFDGKKMLVFFVTLLLLIAVIPIARIAADTQESEYHNDQADCLECNDLSLPIMRPDRETRDKWIEAYNALPVATIDENALKTSAMASVPSFSMLDWVPYVPDERHQGSCGNCWVWAGTGCLEIAHAVENDVNDRLSIQFFNSNYGLGDGEDYACCGGFLGDFAAAYSGGFAVPWDNFNANWQDGNTECGDVTNVHRDSIVTMPRYNLGAVTAYGVATHDVDQHVAIATIKHLLQNGYPIYFAFYLPDDSAWTAFGNFWDAGPEEAIWNNFFCGQDYNDDEGEGGGHAVLCVGYNDEAGTANDYWIMLNSWGTAGGNRPNGVFRVAMDINYKCELDGLSSEDNEYSLIWMFLEVDFTNSAPKADANGPYTGEEGTAILFDASGSSDPDGHALEYAWDFDNDGNWDTGWSPDPTITHTWCDDHYGTVGLMVKEQSTDEQLTDTDLAWVTVNNVAPTANAGADQIVDEGDTVDFSGSFTDPGTCDTHSIDWDFGDGNTASGALDPIHVYGDNGVYTASLTVTDDDGGVDTDELTVTVINVDPTIEANSMGQPNWQFILPVVHTLDFDARVTDPGSDDLTFDWDWGDATSDTTIYYNDGVGPDPYPSPDVNPMDVTDTVGHIYMVPGDYTMTLTVTDDDGGSDGVAQSIHVADVEEAKHITNQYIQDLQPDTVFKGKANQRKKTFDNMFDALDEMLANENYYGMIQHLNNNMRERADGYEIDANPNNDWIIDPLAQQEICQKIDDITAYLALL